MEVNLDDDYYNSRHDNWDYQMRRSKQMIIPGLFLGPYAVAMKNRKQELIDDGITHIICVRSIAESKFVKPNFPSDFEYLVLEINDSVDQIIIPYFPKVKQFIDECLKKNGKVLVHGNIGISRSATLVISYIMHIANISASQAIKFVRKKRFCIHPNLGFIRQLTEYEPILKAQDVKIGTNHKKRAFEWLIESDQELKE